VFGYILKHYYRHKKTTRLQVAFLVDTGLQF
jgi:hypothetical protein